MHDAIRVSDSVQDGQCLCGKLDPLDARIRLVYIKTIEKPQLRLRRVKLCERYAENLIDLSRAQAPI